MATIIRATTPTITFKYNTVTVSNLAVAELTLKQGGETVILKHLSEATVGADTVSWKLTQEETLSLGQTMVEICCDWKTNDGTRGRSNKASVNTDDPGINEVI